MNASTGGAAGSIRVAALDQERAGVREHRCHRVVGLAELGQRVGRADEQDGLLDGDALGVLGDADALVRLLPVRA